MKIGHFIIEYYAELLVPKDKFSLLNKNNIKWFPVMDSDRANNGWVFFDSMREYRKAKKIIKQ